MKAQIISKGGWIYNLALLLLTLAAAGLRLFRLGEWSFWEDEIFSFSGKEDGFTYSFIRRSLTTDLIHQFILRWGTNEWTARLVPALTGILTIPIFYLLLRRHFGRPLALLSAGLLAISTWHLYWSQNARFYVALLLFYTLAAVFFFIGLEENRPWLLVLALICFGLAIKERLLAAFFLPAAGLYLAGLFLFKFERPAGLNWRNAVIFFVPVGLAGLGFLWPYLSHLSAWFTAFGYVNNNPLWLAAGFVYYTGLPTVALAGLGLPYLLKHRSRAGLFFGLNAVLPVALVMLLSPVQYTANRYMFVSLTSWILLASLSLQRLVGAPGRPAKALAAALIACLLLVPLAQDAAYFQTGHGNRADWRMALQYVSARKNPGDQLFVANPDVAQFYLGAPQLGFSELRVDQLAVQGRRAWFIEDLNTAARYPEQLAWVKAHAAFVANFDVRTAARTYTMRVYCYPPSTSLKPETQ